MVAGAVIRQGVVSAIAFGSIERSLVIRDGVVVTNLSREDIADVTIAEGDFLVMKPTTALMAIGGERRVMWPSSCTCLLHLHLLRCILDHSP